MFGNLVGTTLQPLGYLLLYLLTPFHNLPTWVLALPSIPASIVGLDTVFNNTVFSYAGDVSHGKSARSTSIRFIIIDTISALFTPVGLYGGNFILQRGGFVWLFGFTTAVVALGALYTILVVHNIIPHKEAEKEEEADEGNESKLKRLLHSLASCITRKRQGYGRLAIILLIVILGTHAISYTTDSNICFLFLQTKFGFDQNAFSDIQSIHFALTGAGAILMILLIQLTNINVLLVGLLSCLSKLGYYLEYVTNFVFRSLNLSPLDMPLLRQHLLSTLATCWAVLEVGLNNGMLTHFKTTFLSGTVPSVCKIIIARIATPAELGKLNTFVALLESLIPLAFVPLFDQLWKLSLLSYPGLNFLITAGILGVIFLLLLIICALPLKDR